MGLEGLTFSRDFERISTEFQGCYRIGIHLTGLVTVVSLQQDSSDNRISHNMYDRCPGLWDLRQNLVAKCTNRVLGLPTLLSSKCRYSYKFDNLRLG